MSGIKRLAVAAVQKAKAGVSKLKEVYKEKATKVCKK